MIQSLWATARAAERCTYQRDRGDPDKPRLTQMGQVVAAAVAVAQARDVKDTGPTQGARKSPNLGVVANRADGSTPCG